MTAVSRRILIAIGFKAGQRMHVLFRQIRKHRIFRTPLYKNAIPSRNRNFLAGKGQSVFPRMHCTFKLRNLLNKAVLIKAPNIKCKACRTGNINFYAVQIQIVSVSVGIRTKEQGVLQIYRPLVGKIKVAFIPVVFHR